MAEWGKVVRIREVLQPGPDGNLVTMYRVQARTKGGTVFSKVVTLEETKPEMLEKILGEQARQLDKALAI